jgi:hypothetical protein
MARFAVPSLVVSVLVLLLAVLAVALGLNLLPSQSEAVEKGTFAPWVIVWMMIVVTDICAVALAGFLFKYGMRGLAKS